MTGLLLVILDDVVAGTLHWLSGGRLRFDYDRAYREEAARTPLSLSMPLQIASHSDRVVTRWLWGLLPDNDAVLRRWARDFHVSAASPFSLLATPVGEDCAGAVRFVAPERIDRVLGRVGNIVWLTKEDVAQRLRELRAKSTPGSAERSPASSASPPRRPRRPCYSATAVGPCRPEPSSRRTF
jgi:serine/threonine-protein kinase HipA